MTVFIDVREPEEFNTGHVDGAINLPMSELMSGFHQLDDVPKDTELVLYCRTGSRSNATMNFLKAKGFNNVVNGINKNQVEARYFR